VLYFVNVHLLNECDFHRAIVLMFSCRSCLTQSLSVQSPSSSEPEKVVPVTKTAANGKETQVYESASVCYRLDVLLCKWELTNWTVVKILTHHFFDAELIPYRCIIISFSCSCWGDALQKSTAPWFLLQLIPVTTRICIAPPTVLDGSASQAVG